MKYDDKNVLSAPKLNKPALFKLYIQPLKIVAVSNSICYDNSIVKECQHRGGVRMTTTIYIEYIVIDSSKQKSP